MQPGMSMRVSARTCRWRCASSAAPASRAVSTSISVRACATAPPQVFGRINTSALGELSSKWTGRVVDNFYYYSKSGYENKLAFDFRRTLFDSETVFFNSATAFEWQEGRKGARIGETLGLYFNVSERMFIAVEAGAGYTTSLNGDESDRFYGSELRVRLRHNVWRPWFFYEFWPAVGWPASNGYERAFGALFRIEIEVG